MALRTLDQGRAERVETLCELLVPGSSRVRPVVYVDAVLTAMPPEEQAHAVEAIDVLGRAAEGGAGALAEHERTPEFALVRALVIEAYYSDFVAPGEEGPGAWAEIDFNPPREADLNRDQRLLIYRHFYGRERRGSNVEAEGKGGGEAASLGPRR